MEQPFDWKMSGWNVSEAMQWSGVSVLEASEGKAKAVLHVADHHRGGGGTAAINGGVVCYLFDTVLGAAIATTWDEGVVSQVTTGLNISFLRMLQAEKEVLGQASVIHRGRSTVFAEAEALDEAGRVCAKASGIFHLIRQPGS